MTDTSPWANPDADDEAGRVVAGDAPGLEPVGSGSPGEEPPGSGPAAPHGAQGGGTAALIPVFGLMLLVLIGLGVALAVYIQRDKTDRFAANEIADDDPKTEDKDEQLDALKAMGLRTIDVPPGLALRFRIAYTNAEWAELLTSSDPVAAGDPDAIDRKTTQLESQGRVANLVSLFSWNELATSRQGQALAFISQSTIYATEADAKADTSRLCGLSVNEKDPLTEFSVPRIGDQATGFSVLSVVPDERKTVDTVVCFRTGRIVHGVVQTSLDGSQDVSLVVALAQRMEAHVALTFERKPEPIDDDPVEAGG